MALAGEKVAVLDHGKSNVKLFVCSKFGNVLDSRSTPNVSLDGANWRFTCLEGLNEWVFSTLAELSQTHSIGNIIVSAHGSAGVLVGNRNELSDDGAFIPMIDNEQQLPEDIASAYENIKGSCLDRGSVIMMGASHVARQLFWMETIMPKVVQRARWFLCLPQYRAWRLSGVATSEFTILGAQCHLWNVSKSCWTRIVKDRNWKRLLPPIASADTVLGLIRPEFATQYALPLDCKVRARVHDSSANFYSYKLLNLEEFCVISTGTWAMVMAGALDPSGLREPI